MKLSEHDSVRHFTATAYIVNDNKVLLVDHKKLGKWLPVGGHVEENETPDQTVLREVKEETGLDIEIVSEKYPDFNSSKVELLNRPFNISLQFIDEKHHHIDLQYIGRTIGRIALDGTEECRWFTTEELEKLEKCPDVLKYFSKQAINIVKNIEVNNTTLNMSGLA